MLFVREFISIFSSYPLLRRDAILLLPRSSGVASLGLTNVAQHRKSLSERPTESVHLSCRACFEWLNLGRVLPYSGRALPLLQFVTPLLSRWQIDGSPAASRNTFVESFVARVHS